MPHLRNYHLFISHAWRYHEDYVKIKNMLDNASLFSYSDYSVPQPKGYDTMSSAALTAEIQGQINPSSVVLVLGGLYVSYSSWIQYEIDYAKAKAKSIIGVTPRGATRTPKAVADAANIIVGWNTNSIVDAIRKYAP